MAEPDEDGGAPAEDEGGKSNLLFFVAIGIGSLLAVLIGSAGGAYLGVMSIPPVYVVEEEEEIIEEEEEVSLVQGLDLAREKPLLASEFGRTRDLLASSMRLPRFPHVSRYYQEIELEPEKRRELTREMVPLGFADDSIESSLESMTLPIKNAANLGENQAPNLTELSKLPTKPAVPDEPSIKNPDPRQFSGRLMEPAKTSTGRMSGGYNLFRVPDAGSTPEPYEARIFSPTITDSEQGPIEASAQLRLP